MSAFQVDRAHIATLALFDRATIERFSGAACLANKLAAANVESLKALYPSESWQAHEFASDAEVYNAARIELSDKPLVILKAVKCLDYQCCEYEGWSASQAKLALDWIEGAAIRALPGYGDAEGWSIDDRAPGEKPAVISLMGLVAGAYKSQPKSRARRA